MTAIESLPVYKAAEVVADRRGDNLTSLLSAYLAGYAAGGNDEVPEGYVTFASREDAGEHMRRIMSGAVGA
ncbi:hypothetical protein [Bifidobacterium sp. UBA744]|uniref:hypothetical protein n=1 Tax=Bifidobacterium sp. UBA744 TaxID=1946112 RepID=UPI0025BEC93B|nr:hypothetical protein [Bifidobacterium sp. UBA744]